MTLFRLRRKPVGGGLVGGLRRGRRGGRKRRVGLGAQPPTPSWGRMLAESQTMIAFAPWLALAPGLAIVLTVLGLNLMGDGLRDLIDPRLRRVRT